MHIAGEHEDHYDPDFFIYNDVVVTYPDESIEIFGYSPDVFPPTDSHSATLVDGRIILIGNFGYLSDRKAGVTQVVTLDCDGWRASIVETHGSGPGWLHKHQAHLSGDGRSIVVSGGTVDPCDDQMLVENIDEWRLDLTNWHWERLTAKRWPRFEVHRADQERLHSWHMRQALLDQHRRDGQGRGYYEATMQRLTEELGGPPQLDLVAELYRPPVLHDVLPEDKTDYRMYRIRIGDVVVRYFEGSFTLQATVEGELPEHVVDQLRQDLKTKLEALEQTTVSMRTIGPV